MQKVNRFLRERERLGGGQSRKGVSAGAAWNNDADLQACWIRPTLACMQKFHKQPEFDILKMAARMPSTQVKIVYVYFMKLYLCAIHCRHVFHSQFIAK